MAPDRVTLSEVEKGVGAYMPAPDDRRDQITLAEIENREVGDSSDARIKVGRSILIWLVPFVGLALLIFTVFSFWTYPQFSDFKDLRGCPTTASASAEEPSDSVACTQEQLPGPEALELWSQARAEWVTQTKDLGQIFIVSSLLPLLATAIGYMVGRNEPTTT